MNEIIKQWENMNPHEAFRIIASVDESDTNLSTAELTELTGVRKFTKIAEGKGDEVATFLNDELVLLTGFYKTLRVLNINTGQSWAVSRPVYPIVDTRDAIFHDSKFIYYAKPIQQGLTIYEYDTTRNESRPIGTASERVHRVMYDPDSSYMQLIGADDKIIVTFDLSISKSIDYSNRIPERERMKRSKIDYNAGIEKITFHFDSEEVSIPYPKAEFLAGIKTEDLFYDERNPDGIFVQSRWYPGLHILFDFKNRRFFKIFLPEWLQFDETTQWKIIKDQLYIWLIRTEKAGMYKVDLDGYPELDEFVDLLYEYGLARRRSGIGEGQRA